jgi:hypothetical protein
MAPATREVVDIFYFPLAPHVVTRAFLALAVRLPNVDPGKPQHCCVCEGPRSLAASGSVSPTGKSLVILINAWPPRVIKLRRILSMRQTGAGSDLRLMTLHRS